MINLENFSALWKAKRVVACRLRCVQKFKAVLWKADVSVNRPPTLRELKAENTILRVVQRESFGGEISSLRLGKPILRSSRLSRITPFLDDEGILRSQVRLENAAMDFYAKHPVLEEAKSRFGQLLIGHNHIQLSHGPPDYVFNEIRRR